MRLTPFKPGSLRLFGINNWHWVETAPGQKNVGHSKSLPLPRWKEIYWYWVVRPLGKLEGLSRRPLGRGRNVDS